DSRSTDARHLPPGERSGPTAEPHVQDDLPGRPVHRGAVAGLDAPAGRHHRDRDARRGRCGDGQFLEARRPCRGRGGARGHPGDEDPPALVRPDRFPEWLAAPRSAACLEVPRDRDPAWRACMSDHILVEHDEAIATVIFNRPKMRNAISLAMWSEIASVTES